MELKKSNGFLFFDSFHGTGTQANDFNESEVLQKQLEHLGRTRGNAIMAVFQKVQLLSEMHFENL